ncbi:MAG: ABC transporter ATP-binding protein [Chloroflexota bacterium]|nr:ABC transporter ATP-binding protein [Chloroflexota bacterium]
MEPVVVVRIQDLLKTYTEGGRRRLVLNCVNIDIIQGEFFVMLGKSGSGKSTLLNMLSGIDSPDDGRVLIDGVDITAMNDTEQTLFRRDYVGIIFQFFNLIPTLTVLENITLPQELRRDRGKEDEMRARELLERVGLADRADSFPDKLSGGEQQRVAIARALAQEPKVLLADEPTGNLDEETGQQILQLLLELTREAGKTLIMATHNAEIAPFADRVCRIHEGRLYVSSSQAFDSVAGTVEMTAEG